MKRILVTGATGRIGRLVVPLLLDRGYLVRVSLHRTPLKANWASLVEAVPGGLAKPAVQDVDAVIHLAGIMPPASDDVVFRTNIEGTFQLLRAMAALKHKPRLVFASSDATYCTGWSLSSYSAPIDENTPHHPSVFYGLSKVLGERMCTFFEETQNIPAVRLRFVWTLDPPEILDLFTQAPYKEFLMDSGKWDEPGVVAVPLEADGRPFTEHICDARDAAEAVVLALESDNAPGHAFNIAGPEPFQYTVVGPRVAGRLGTVAVEGRCRGIHSYSMNIEKARNVLGYRPRYHVMDSLETTLSAVATAPPR